MSREKRCQYCPRILSGRGVSKFCSECRPAARKQAKYQSNQAYYNSLWESENEASLEDHREVNRRFRLISYYDLTNKKLDDCSNRAAALQEEYLTSKDAIHETAFRKLTEAKDFLINTSSNLPIAFADVETDICAIRNDLNSQPDASRNLVTDRLNVYIDEMLRHMGLWMERGAFARLRRKANEILKKWQERGDLLNTTHGYFVLAELFRQEYFANPQRPQLLKKAQDQLKYAEHVRSRYKGEYEQAAAFLDFYAFQGEITLALDANEADRVTSNVESLRDRADEVGQVCGTSLITDTAYFLASLQQARYYLNKDTALAELHFKAAQEQFPNMGFRPLSTRHILAYIEASLALAKNDQESQKHLQQYLNMFSDDPCYEQWRNLRELQRDYSEALVDSSKCRRVRIHVDTVFSYLQTVLFTI